MKDRPTQTFVTDGWKDGQKLIVGRLEIESIADRRTEPRTHRMQICNWIWYSTCNDMWHQPRWQQGQGRIQEEPILQCQGYCFLFWPTMRNNLHNCCMSLALLLLPSLPNCASHIRKSCSSNESLFGIHKNL